MQSNKNISYWGTVLHNWFHEHVHLMLQVTHLRVVFNAMYKISGLHISSVCKIWNAVTFACTSLLLEKKVACCFKGIIALRRVASDRWSTLLTPRHNLLNLAILARVCAYSGPLQSCDGSLQIPKTIKSIIQLQDPYAISDSSISYS